MDKWLEDAYEVIKRMPKRALDIRERAKADLNYFATLVNPGYMYGQVHRDIYRWMQEYSLFGMGAQTSNKLIMLPRGHLKSHMVATWCAWIITRHPEVTILYISATAELAETQLFAIQNIMESKIYQQLFPEYINPAEGLRERWSQRKVMIDHLERKNQNIRDATIATAGLTTNTTGWHADIIVADDLVIPENAYTLEGRESVIKKVSQFTSIRNAGGFTMACGTRYFPTDIYNTWKNQMYDVYDDDDQLLDKLPVWEIREYKVEENGIFIWPRMIRPSDNKAFGFNRQVLARIEAEYEDRVQFYAQYYNDPNDPDSNRIDNSKFQYYNPRFLKREGSNWFFNGRRLNVYAAVDFAFSLNKDADYTAIVVIGVDSESSYYILDIDRFKTKKTIEYFEHVRDLHSRWNFKKLSAEVTVAQIVIVEAIKDYVKQYGLSLSVEEHRPNRAEGSKEQRIAAVLEPLYEQMRMWHFEGGLTPVLEEELILARPAHDDIKDALASAVIIAVKPAANRGAAIADFLSSGMKRGRFGGVAFK